MIRAVLFDLDGTLVDTERLWVSALVDWLRDLGISYTREAASALVYGHAWSHIYAELVRRHPALAATRSKDASEAVRPYFLRLRRQFPNAFPVAYANGETMGYLVTAAAVAEGGYEAAGASYKSPGSPEAILAETVRLLSRPGHSSSFNSAYSS